MSLLDNFRKFQINEMCFFNARILERQREHAQDLRGAVRGGRRRSLRRGFDLGVDGGSGHLY